MSYLATDAEIEQMLLEQHGYIPKSKPEEIIYNDTSEVQNAVVQSRFEPLDFDNIFELHHVTRPKLDLYKWQVEEQMRLSGYLDPRGQKQPVSDKNPLRYSMVAANGAGKDSIILTPFAIWCILTQVRCRVVLTSASHQQLKGQTQGYIQDFVDDFNAWARYRVLDYIDLKVVCPQTDSEIVMFATDMAGKAEGWHPKEDGRWLVMILNEVKSIKEDIIRATLRCSGYTHWVEVSSPGLIDTHFYKTISRADCTYPEVPKLGQSFVRRIIDTDCPHLSDAYKKALIDEFGDENHPIVLSALKAQFMSADTVYVIPADFFNYEPLGEQLLGDRLRAGLDLALGGDETVLSVWKGNKQIGLETWRIRYEPTLHTHLIHAFEKYKLKAEDINADAGGLGLPIIHRLDEAGWPVNMIKNDQKAFRKVYRNRGTELYWTLRRLIQDKVLIFLKDEKQIDQLKKRRYNLRDNNTLQLESKRDARARGEPSPDRADATALAFADIDATEVAKLAVKKTSDLKVGKYIINFDDDPDEQIQGWLASRNRNTHTTSASMMDKIANN